jgi:hypothetical protein
MAYSTITKKTTRSNTYAIIFVSYHSDDINIAPCAVKVQPAENYIRIFISGQKNLFDSDEDALFLSGLI